MTKIKWLRKIITIVVGSVIAAYGITLAMYAGFGGATLAVLWEGIAKTFHISIGMASMIVALTFALAEKNHWQVKVVRMILDIMMVVAGVLLGGKFGLCTIVAVAGTFLLTHGVPIGLLHLHRTGDVLNTRISPVLAVTYFP